MTLDSHRGKVPFLREAVVLVLLALPLLVTASTIDAANWVKGLPSLRVLVVVSVVVWAVMARSRVPWWIGHPLALVMGLAAAFVVMAIAQSDGLGDLASRIGGWFGAVGSEGGHDGTAMTGVVLVVVTLWMAHASVWLGYRYTFGLLAALPGLGVLLVVLTFLPSDYYWYFFMYLLAAAPGIAYRHRGRWAIRSQRAPVLGTLAGAVALMALTLGPVWRTPAPEGTVMPLVDRLEEPWYSFSERWSSLFHGVPNRKDWMFFSPPLDLPFQGPIVPEEDVLFLVDSEEPYRWRMRVYDTYTGRGWMNREDPVRMDPGEVPLARYEEELEARKEVNVSVRMYSKANALVSVGEPLAVDMPFLVEVSPEPSFRVEYDGSRLTYLPPEVRKYSEGLTRAETGHSLVDSQTGFGAQDGALYQQSVADLHEAGFRLARVTKRASDDSGEGGQQTKTSYVVAERLEASPSPPVAILGERVLVPPRQYETRGSVSDASASMLRKAGQEYPHWVSDRYLQLPSDFPDTVTRLASKLAQDADNPYDAAESIRRHLLSLSYTLDVEVPPEGKDWVEFFLLVQRRGYCQNYASAMITMLRSLGIPARLVAGFAPGIWDESRGLWEVQSKHYHAWPEVYFPSYGWVEFEPTPADVQPALEALGIGAQGRFLRDLGEVDVCIENFDPEECRGELPTGSGLIETTDDPDDIPGDPSAFGVGGGGSGPLTKILPLVGIGLALVLPLGLFLVAYFWRGWSRLGYVTTTYASMCLLGGLAGVALRTQDTPWEYSARLKRVLPQKEDAVSHITERFVYARYSGEQSAPFGQEILTLRASWRSVRRGLVGRILRRLLPRGGGPTPS